MDKTAVFTQIDKLKQEMTQALMSLISVPAVAPENGGDGEDKKAQRLIQLLQDAGFDKIERFDAPDARVSSGKRPNVIAYLNGASDEKRLWIITHLDVVPAGDETAWTKTKPFQPTLTGDQIFGRGSEDNGQSMVASIYALKALKQLGVKPEFTVGLAFVADEEQGSEYGIQHLMEQNIFRPNDLIVVPDSGNENGSFIEVAEKSILWLKIRTVGKQTHGSRPDKGLNAHRVGMEAALALDRMLYEKHPEIDELFDVPVSTFEPTKKELNVDCVNVIPGEDTVYFDCRVLPRYSLDEILSDIEGLLSYYEEKTGAKITFEVLQKQSSPVLEVDKAEVVQRLKTAIKEARGIDASVGGIGGGSCSAFFRKIGIPAVVWSTILELAHQPDEYAMVSNMVADAKVFALLAMT
ncbi:MAG: M20 family metallo-hydrolase [Candidatus Bathyarchaeia archaeon]|jgi:succinyl-diaminopimelate desuccinylase